MDFEEKKELSAKIEAILFASGESVGVERICLGLEITRKEAEEILSKLMGQYELSQGGLRILKLNTSYQMCSAPDCASAVHRVLETRSPPKLTQPALEVLAIIAYHQPTTRAYIDQIRGVDSTYTISSLLIRGLVEECGRLMEMPGRPTLYQTTDAFLRVFHLEHLSNLPDLDEPEPEMVQLTIPETVLEEVELEQERFL
ncbi:MAG: SMC-Scp complex subunit ScpB [Eubacteriales bacterium]